MAGGNNTLETDAMSLPRPWATTGEVVARAQLAQEWQKDRQMEIYSSQNNNNPGDKNTKQKKKKKNKSNHCSTSNTKHLERSVFAHSSPAFRQLLQSRTLGSFASTAKSQGGEDNNYKTQKCSLAEARSRIIQSRILRIKALQARKDMATLRTTKILATLASDIERQTSSIDAISTQVDQTLIALAEDFTKLIESERFAHTERRTIEEHSCAEQEAQTRRAFKMAVFALHLESETEGKIAVTKLASTNPQFARCKRAAVENIKTGFFDQNSDSKTPPTFAGLSVLDIYKVENQQLLSVFQKESQNKSERTGSDVKVKGLFCHLPPESLSRVVAQGFLTDEQAGSTKAMRHTFRRSWFSFSNDETGYAEKQVKDAAKAMLPRPFSRYSTLESDRNMIQNGTKDIDERGDSTIRYLCLCRVLLGKTLVSDSAPIQFLSTKEGELLLPANKKKDALLTSGLSQYDSVYSPASEEYVVMNPTHVLPEFLIQFKFIAGGDTGRGDTNTSTGVDGLKLSQNNEWMTTGWEAYSANMSKRRRECLQVICKLVAGFFRDAARVQVDIELETEQEERGRGRSASRMVNRYAAKVEEYEAMLGAEIQRTDEMKKVCG